MTTSHLVCVTTTDQWSEKMITCKVLKTPGTKSLRDISKPLVLAALVTLLVACGDSDLEELQINEIRTAQRANDPATGDSDQPAAAEGSETDKIKEALELVFEDNFDGSVIDDTLWNTQLKWGPDVSINNDMQYYVDEQNVPDLGFTPFLFDGNTLSITAQTTEPQQLELAQNKPYLSGVLSSHDKFDFKFGYAEIRAKLPSGAGFWPGFWMLTSEFIEQKPQLFVMEARGDNANTVFHRYNFTDANDVFQPSEFMPSGGDDFSAGFHTYGVLWGPASIFFYVDGVKMHTIENNNIPSQEMYLILSLAFGNDFAGKPTDQTVLPGSFDIDYVRVYQSR